MCLEEREYHLFHILFFKLNLFETKDTWAIVFFVLVPDDESETASGGRATGWDEERQVTRFKSVKPFKKNMKTFFWAPPWRHSQDSEEQVGGPGRRHLVASGCCSSVKTNSNTRFSWGSIVVSNVCGGGRTLWVVQLDSTRTGCVTVAVRPLRSILEEKCLAWLVLEAVCSQCSLSHQAARSSWTEPRADSWVAGPTANWAIS